MGLFVGDDGSYRGWLAALLCCGSVAVNDDEKATARDAYLVKDIQTNVCTQQPALLSALSSRPVAHPIHDHDRERRISDRPPSLKPLDFGEISLLGHMSLPVGQKTPKNNVKSKTIGHPTAFRRLELTEEQRRSLIPLQLEPVTLRDSVLLSGNEKALEYQYTQRDSLTGGLGHGKSCTSYRPKAQEPHNPTYASTTLPADGHRTSQIARDRQLRRPVLSSYSSSSSMRSMRRQALESHSSSSSSSPRQSIDWSRFNRKRNSLRKPSSESMDSEIEQEILELNTIVEEIRSDSSRSKSSDEHVSAVAPLMSIRARSETLNDIGSAFSRPRPIHTDSFSGSETKSESETRTASPMENRLSRPFAEMPDLSTTMSTVQPVHSRPDSKIGGWLSNIIGTSSKPAKRTREDFYSCKPQHRRTVSESSSAISELDSPGMTIASQWSAGHNRTVTADSVMTPASTAPSTGHRVHDAEQMARSTIKWVSGTENQSEVGLAI